MRKTPLSVGTAPTSIAATLAIAFHFLHFTSTCYAADDLTKSEVKDLTCLMNFVANLRNQNISKDRDEANKPGLFQTAKLNPRCLPPIGYYVYDTIVGVTHYFDDTLIRIDMEPTWPNISAALTKRYGESTEGTKRRWMLDTYLESYHQGQPISKRRHWLIDYDLPIKNTDKTAKIKLLIEYTEIKKDKESDPSVVLSICDLDQADKVAKEIYAEQQRRIRP